MMHCPLSMEYENLNPDYREDFESIGHMIAQGQYASALVYANAVYEAAQEDDLEPEGDFARSLIEKIHSMIDTEAEIVARSRGIRLTPQNHDAVLHEHSRHVADLDSMVLAHQTLVLRPGK